MDPLVLTGAVLIDGTGADPVGGRAIVIEDGRIASVVNQAELPRGRRLDPTGCTVLARGRAVARQGSPWQG